jgi:hypothetical protein
MTSKRQLAANRANARRSTGPKTKAGKARSARNSLTHGLTSRQIVIGDEDPKKFEELREGLERDFKPTTTVQSELVERLAGLLWRLRRVPVLEAALMKARFEEISARDPMSFLSPEERKPLEELKDWLWRDREARSRLDEAILAETTDQAFLDDPTTSHLGPPLSEEELKMARLYEASLEPWYGERLARYRKELEKEQRPVEEVPENPNQATINLGLSLIKDSENHDTLGKLSRYEASLLNAITRTLSLLHSLQKSDLLPNRRIVDGAS